MVNEPEETPLSDSPSLLSSKRKPRETFKELKVDHPQNNDMCSEVPGPEMDSLAVDIYPSSQSPLAPFHRKSARKRKPVERKIARVDASGVVKIGNKEDTKLLETEYGQNCDIKLRTKDFTESAKNLINNSCISGHSSRVEVSKDKEHKPFLFLLVSNINVAIAHLH